MTIRTLRIAFIILASISTSLYGCESRDDVNVGYDDKDASYRADVIGTYQAEDHTFQKGCTKTSRHTGYTGSGYMDYGGNDSMVEWDNVIVASAGEYTLKFRYANGGAGDRRCIISVDDMNVGNVDFNPTGAWTIWESASVTVRLSAGKNEIRVTSNPAGGPNLDKMEVVVDAVCVPKTCSELNTMCGAADDGCGNILNCDEGCDNSNIALRRLTEQSSTGFGADSSRAVDGNPSRNFSNNTCTFTFKEPKPWWRVNFNGPQKVTGVKIWTLSGWEHPLNDFHVDCLDEKGNILAGEDFSGTAGETIEIDIQAEGVYSVQIQLTEEDRLPLCEVEVYGYPENACIPKTCSDVGAACGTEFDGCGGTLDCGGCESGFSCEENQCEPVCPVSTCEDNNATCGYTYTNCQASLYCGGCSEGRTCFQNECISCVSKTCSEISANACGSLDDGCGNSIDCGTCNRTTFLVPISLEKNESWEELAFLATVPAGMKTNNGKPSVIAVRKDENLNDLHLDYLRRYRPGKVYTIGTKVLYEGETKLNARTLDEFTCELAQFYGTSDTAVMSNSQDYHKSLSASGLAGRLRIPLFYFNEATVSSETISCLSRLGVKNVVTVGASPQVASRLNDESIVVDPIADEYEVISWLEEKGHGVDYFAVCNSYDRSRFFAPKSSLAAPILAAARNGAVVPLSMESEYNTPCELTQTETKPEGVEQGVPFEGKYQWKVGTCLVNGKNYNVALSRKLVNNPAFSQANIDFNGDGDFTDEGEFLIKGELRKFGEKTYLVDIEGRKHFADVRFTYPPAEAIKTNIQAFHDALGHHPKYMVLVGLPDAIPPHLIINQGFDLLGTMTDYVYSDVDDDPLIDIAIGRIIGENASIATLAAARSTTYEDLLDYSWKNNVLTTGNFDGDRERDKKVFENAGFNVDSTRYFRDIKDVEYAYIWHSDHGSAWSIAAGATGKDSVAPISPAVALSIGWAQGNISERPKARYDFAGYGSVKLLKMGAVGIYAASKNSGGNGVGFKVATIVNTILYEGATLGEAHLHALNAVMLRYEQHQEYVWRPIFYGDPALKPYIPEKEPAIAPAKTVVNGNTVTVHGPQDTWKLYNWDGTCPGKPETQYDYHGPGLSPVSSTCGWEEGSSITKRGDKGVRYISIFKLDRKVTSITQQDGIDEGLGWNYTDNNWYYAPNRYLVNEHWNGSSTVYMNLRFELFSHETGEFDNSYSQIKYFVQ